MKHLYDILKAINLIGAIAMLIANPFVESDLIPDAIVMMLVAIYMTLENFTIKEILIRHFKETTKVVEIEKED